jgi:hypothetical protein
MSVAIAIAAATVFDALYMLFRRFDIDYWEGSEMPHRWIAWGTCRGGRPGYHCAQYDFRYFLLRLPSWQWVRDYVNGPDAWCWGQLTLFRFAGKWHADYWRVA